MTASHNHHAQAGSANTDSDRKSGRQNTVGNGSYVVVYHDDGYGSVAGVGAYESLEELDQIMEHTRLYDHGPTNWSGTRSTGSTLACSTSAASTDVNRGSLSDTTTTQSAASGLTASSLDTHDRLNGYNSNYPTAAASQGPSRFNYTSLGGDATHPSPLDMWAGKHERHESIAYRLEKPSARKHKANKKHH